MHFKRLLRPGPFYFTKLLLPVLFKASTPGNKSRVVNTSSAASMHGASLSGSGLDFATFKDSPHRRKYNITQLYGQSKLVCLAIASGDLVSRPNSLSPTRGTSYSPRNLPGGMVTKL